MNKGRKKIIKNLEKTLGEGSKQEMPLQITQGKGEDKSSNEDGDNEVKRRMKIKKRRIKI